MKSVTTYGLLVECFWLALFCGSATPLLADSDHHKWDKLYLVHHWPVTVCMMNDNECKDPPMYWTIHGLWPDKAEECNRSWHFNVSELKDFMEDMREYWPDILHTNHTHFWRHEWEKHGTCAAELEALNSQKKYFQKTLEFYRKINLNSFLLKVGIKPGPTYYQLAAIKEALESVYNITPKIQCLPPEEGRLQVMGQIKFCLTKEFTLRNCTEPQSDLSSAHEDNSTEDLSICNDTLTYYPSHMHT
ncbi:ribonuclease T2 [Python bivittatus]|uniref:Ribonuclease T2 n=1 Tax=Python bivittatus TaxID=176946 RepID=A0A9F2WHH6_PYTBI|nr:ribonuclease T2 [Python bivittatus]